MKDIHEKVAELLAFPELLANSTIDAYKVNLKASKRKPSRIVSVCACRVCGNTRTTLLKYGDSYICKKCKLKSGEE